MGELNNGWKMDDKWMENGLKMDGCALALFITCLYEKLAMLSETLHEYRKNHMCQTQFVDCCADIL